MRTHIIIKFNTLKIFQNKLLIIKKISLLNEANNISFIIKKLKEIEDM